MREIKFRAWDKERRIMWGVSSIDFDTEEITNGGDIFSFPDVELMQYTGLKDKNGVEIFQGDIVRCTRGCPHEVIWLEEYGGAFVGGMPAWYLSGLMEGYAWTGEEEVLGNIYANPELLKERDTNE